MTRRLLYIIGIPGSGKTSVMRALLSRVAFPLDARRCDYRRGAVLTRYPLRRDRAEFIYQLGEDRGGPFAGTDLLSMSAGKPLGKALDDYGWGRVVGEGDRLASAPFFRAALDAGYELDIVHLDTPEDVAAKRREGRGSNQNPGWLLGRATKVERLAEDWATSTLDGRRPVEELADHLTKAYVFQEAA